MTNTRGSSPRARRSAPPPTGRPRAAATDDEHACRIAKLRALKNKLSARLDRVNELLGAELIAARQDKTLYAVIGQAVQVAEGRPQTADDLKRVERQLRKATAKALRRRAPGGDKARVVSPHDRRNTASMTNPYRRRIEVREEWFHEGPPPPNELAATGQPVPTLVGEDLDEPDDEDEESDEDDELEDDDEDCDR